MITEVREAEWALHRARRLLHDVMIDIRREIVSFRTDTNMSNANDPLSAEALEFLKPPFLVEMIKKREHELEMAKIRSELHVAMLGGAL